MRSFKSNLRLGEFSGSLGDLGTLLPIMLSLSLTGQVDLTASLIFGGLWNILTGLTFRMPMCVQPMKSIAAIALTNHMSIGSVMSAGMGVSAVVMVLGLTRTIHYVQKYTPMSVIRGIQLGTAISFGTKAADLVKQAKSFGGESWTWDNNYEWAVFAFIIVFIFYYRSKRIPTAMILFTIGLIIAFIKLYTNPPPEAVYPKIGVYTVRVTVPTWEEFKHGFVSASLGQIPLTSLNSVIALAALAKDLFPERPTGTPTIAVSVGMMNLVGCFFGSIPFCHGSGGLAAQYRFGARTEVSIIILGLLKIFFGLFFGSSLSGLIASYPSAILGVMLFVSGIELGAVARTVNDGIYDDRKRHANFIVMITTASMLVGFKNDGIGFLGGLVAAVCFYIGSKYMGRMDDEDIQTLTEAQGQGQGQEQGQEQHPIGGQLQQQQQQGEDPSTSKASVSGKAKDAAQEEPQVNKTINV
ncbi:hypothetical protein BCR41DRAFT_378536 [Lobosporangium transversale]|uniref:Sulfate transporter family-domain-containing protein n=1 Tax=Lobosporangium transversale TaxID=64571 RepID=A0A1Y2GHD3_9FUNG|nr:hypothetical protein BCR41DRAFT_378536 [Lobosporangium transversale]ORZ09122.1 hypothetical protein BCR41DRAFT_378536 [Lobosporangium transversale]|eukprot:XP_021878749.1 hypothetical protein BCR41DRAFT_378536 [Lobosporangium transversale]